MSDDNGGGLNTPEYRAAVEAADKAMRHRQVVVSGNRLGPRFVWSLRPLTVADLSAAVSGSPYVIHEAAPFPAGIKWGGAPSWAMHCYVVNVEVKATFAESQK